MKSPIAFTTWPVTLITSTVYIALLATLLIIHLVVPPAPSVSPYTGINIVEAWQDLKTLSNGFHPYNSHQNDEVRAWLLRRIESIVKENGAQYASEKSCGADTDTYGELINSEERHQDDQEQQEQQQQEKHHRPSSDLSQEVSHLPNSHLPNQASVVVFNDMISNLTSSEPIFGQAGLSVYFEGTNIVVYIRGSEDDPTEWWKTSSSPKGHGGVLVNAHYDSVATGYGATDDGIGVVSILQLINYFTTQGQQPKKGVVALFNNGEEDFLNGARAFALHPMSRFPHTFLNLEGTGGGNRALLFRTTDAEISKAYASSKYPFGSVLTSDGFKRGMIRSQTDYVVFNQNLGMRGLDVAFIEPRARYHTDQDDTRHTSVDSLWHMLSGAIATMQYLTDDTSATLEGKNEKHKAASGSGTDGVWFDLFGRVFAVFELHTLFAVTVTLLVVTPIILFAIGALLYRINKLYLFCASQQVHSAEGDEVISIGGWRGFFRFPIIVIISSGALVGLAFLITKFNPFIVYSSLYSVWAMMLSAWIFLAWFFARVGDSVRPSAFHRTYALLWMLLGAWAILIAVAVLEDRYGVAAGYFLVFDFVGIALASVVGFCELFALPTKMNFAEEMQMEADSAASVHAGSISSGRLLAPDPEEATPANEDDAEPTESTSLLRRVRHPTFANYSGASRGRASSVAPSENPPREGVYGFEQHWSSTLPTWTWIIQFLLVAPVAIIFIGQNGLLVASAMYQTLADGNSALQVYLIMAAFSILFVAPLGPFLHRLTFHVPLFLLCVFVGTLIYNLVAFPFSANNRFKIAFLQQVDLDTGINTVTLFGARRDYLHNIMSNLPSTVGVLQNCTDEESTPQCSWSGLDPHVVPNTPDSIPPSFGYTDWLSFNATRIPGRNVAVFNLQGRNTRACRIAFDTPISDVSVSGSGFDSRFACVPADGSGSREIRLWSRTWEKPWNVTVKWTGSQGKREGEQGIDGRVVCLWNDEGLTGTVPALDEIRRFAPVWAAVTKRSDGLVEGSKSFML